MTTDEKYITRCIELARLGLGETAPNPMVGAVIVHNGEIIGEGFHRKFGGAHAEVIAIGSVMEKDFLSMSTLYVNLEPCSHHGKTPPCSDLIVEKGIKRVVIGTRDSFPLVAGRGIEKLKNAGVEVVEGVLSRECRELNIRFFTFYEKKRPYIILKWAQSRDGFVDRFRNKQEAAGPTRITGDESRKLVHKLRAEEAAIMVGTNTVLADNPSLTTRYWAGKNPVRIVFDKLLKLPRTLNVFDSSSRTIVFNSLANITEGNLDFVRIDFEKEPLPQVMDVLFRYDLQSLIVEGGPTLLSHFVRLNLWDEARVFTGNVSLGSGVKAPEFPFMLVSEEKIGNDVLVIFKNS